MLEIQVRTVLQHAWAAISHALQYKRESEIPIEFRRRLIRLSGLLELADEEFALLRQDQVLLIERIDHQILAENFSIKIDAISISKYLESTSTTKPILDAVKSSGMEVREEEEYKTNNSHLLIVCRALNIQTIDDLDQLIMRLSSHALALFKEFGHDYSQSAVGSPAHWVAVFLAGLHREVINKQAIKAELGWDSSYFSAVLSAGAKVVKRRKQNRT